MADPKVDLLAECLEAIRSGELTVEECLDRHPEYRQELSDLLQVAVRLQSVPEVGPRLAFRRAARRRLLEHAASSRPAPWWERLRRAAAAWGQTAWMQPGLTWVVVGILLAALLTTGTVYAADRAVPGDALYSLDRAMEKIQLRLRSEPEQIARLELAFANERLLEAQALAEAGDTAGLTRALEEYDALVSGLSATVASAPNGSGKALGELVRSTLAGHEARWGGVFTALDEGSGEEPGGPGAGPTPPEASCGAGPLNPAARVLADSYADISYDQILAWFCEDGYPFSDIKLALKTRQEDDAYPVETLLALKEQLGGWGRVWQEIGVVGKPEKTDSPAEGAGPPGQDSGPPGQTGKDKAKDKDKDKGNNKGRGGGNGNGNGPAQGNPGDPGGPKDKDKDKESGGAGQGRRPAVSGVALVEAGWGTQISLRRPG